jgi:mRNA-degrading endonuclease RelE of RelBE toxin-antitoxin system
MYTFEIIPHLQEILKKLSKKDKVLYERVLKKIDEVISSKDVEHYKNLKYNLSDKKRVHIGHFVLVFLLSKQKNNIKFLDFDNHDKIYNK